MTRRPAQLIRVARTTTAALAVSAVLAAGLSSTSQARPAAVTVAAPVDYCVGQCADIVPPGQNGNATFADLLLFQGFGVRPPHFSDTLKPYERLVWNSEGITDDGLDPYFDDAAFGVQPADVASTFKPRADVTIVRDKSRGIPHITGTTREGTMFGAGYAGAQDRLFVMDIFRHLGRGQLTPFAGGAAANRAFEQEFWRTAPYTEADLQKQYDDADERYGANGLKMQKDIQAWVDGVNHYINTVGIAYPGEYVALGLPTPQPWKVTDVVATAAVVAGIFGTGGGGEMASALALLEAQAKYGVAEGTKVWESFRSQNDPEANTTVHNGTSFPYGVTGPNPAGRAMPDRGSVTPEPDVIDQTGSAETKQDAETQEQRRLQAAETGPGQGITARHLRRRRLPRRLRPKGMSNALLVSGQHTESGNPIAVYGPQTGYFAPQLLLRQELQGPGVSSRGVAFAGLNFYTLIGRGADYSWSATSAGQDITDTYAVPLCEPGGGTPTKNSTPLPVPRSMRADREAGTAQRVVPQPGFVGARGVVHVGCPAYEVRDRHRIAGPSRASRCCSPRTGRRTGTRRGRRSGSCCSTIRTRSTRRPTSRRPRVTSATRSTGSTRTRPRSRTTTPATTRSGRPVPIRTCRPGARTSGRAGTRTPTGRRTRRRRSIRRWSTRTT